MTILLVLVVGTLVAYANGANDNFKGVATLLGSKTTGYRKALGWATITTALGSLTATVIARDLLTAFSGKGLVPAEALSSTVFPVSVALAAGCTVLLATRLGFPISTTHALLGALVGAGLMASPTGIDTARLVQTFLIPLLISPLIAIAGTGLLYLPLRWTRTCLNVSPDDCLCVDDTAAAVESNAATAGLAVQTSSLPVVTAGTKITCAPGESNRVWQIDARNSLDAAHYLSAGAVSFARGLNDTPKIAALLLVGNAWSPSTAMLVVGIAIMVGGWISARRVATTMSHRVTEMNPGQGLTANLVTAALVIGASRFGVPVSTTHVSCGSLFGIGTVTGQAHWRAIGGILLAWAVTLPMAGLLGAALMATLA